MVPVTQVVERSFERLVILVTVDELDRSLWHALISFKHVYI